MQSLPLDAYKQFASNINDRIASRQHLTEDSVRYAFFHALLLRCGERAARGVLKNSPCLVKGNSWK